MAATDGSSGGNGNSSNGVDDATINDLQQFIDGLVSQAVTDRATVLQMQQKLAEQLRKVKAATEERQQAAKLLRQALVGIHTNATQLASSCNNQDQTQKQQFAAIAEWMSTHRNKFATSQRERNEAVAAVRVLPPSLATSIQRLRQSLQNMYTAQQQVADLTTSGPTPSPNLAAFGEDDAEIGELSVDFDQLQHAQQKQQPISPDAEFVGGRWTVDKVDSAGHHRKTSSTSEFTFAAFPPEIRRVPSLPRQQSLSSSAPNTPFHSTTLPAPAAAATVTKSNGHSNGHATTTETPPRAGPDPSRYPATMPVSLDEWNLSTAKLDEFIHSQLSHEALFYGVGRANRLMEAPMEAAELGVMLREVSMRSAVNRYSSASSTSPRR